MAEKVVVALLLVFLLLGAFADPIIDGIKGWRTVDTTQSASVVTGAGATTANMTLTGDLFQNDVAEVISISSNISGESPIASSYDSNNNYLLVGALNPSATHTLTVNYYAETTNVVIRAIGGFMSLFVIGGLLVCIFMIFRKKKRH